MYRILQAINPSPYSYLLHFPGFDYLGSSPETFVKCENGQVLLPARAPWLSDYVTELTSFPGSRHDDQVDSTTQALDHLRTYERKRLWVSPELLARSRIPDPRFARPR